MGNQLAQLALVLLLPRAPGADEPTSDGRLAFAVAVAAAAVAWPLVYGLLPGASDGVCLVPVVPAFRSGCNALVLATLLAASAARAGNLPTFRAPSSSSSSSSSSLSSVDLSGGAVPLGLAWLACLLLFTLVAGRAVATAEAQTLARLEASALGVTVASLESVSGVLCVAEAVDAEWATEASRRRGGWSRRVRCARTPQELGRLLAAFEDRVRYLF